jgi:hypothetical protein
MADSPKRSTAGSDDSELECSQLTLEDWANARRARPTETRTRGRASGEVAAASSRNGDEPRSPTETGSNGTPHRPSATELLETPGALLTRSHLRELGLERRAIDAVFRALAVVFLPGYSRPMIRVEEFLELLERCTFRDDRVRPIAGAS